MAGRGLPRHVAQVVADHVLAQAVEVAPLAQAGSRAAAEAVQEEPVETPPQTPHGAQVGQHRDLGGGDGLAALVPQLRGQEALHPAAEAGPDPGRSDRRGAAGDSAYPDLRRQHLPRPADAREHARGLLQQRRPSLPQGEPDRPSGCGGEPQREDSSSSSESTQASGRSTVTVSFRSARASRAAMAIITASPSASTQTRAGANGTSRAARQRPRRARIRRRPGRISAALPPSRRSAGGCRPASSPPSRPRA